MISPCWPGPPWTCSSAAPLPPPPRCRAGARWPWRDGEAGEMQTRTLCEIFYHSVETHRKPDHLRVKRQGAWRDISSEELRRAVEELSMGLRALGVGKGDRVALLSENRPEWAYADLATLCVGAVDTPIYPNLPAAQVLYVLGDSQSKVAFVSNPAQA